MNDTISRRAAIDLVSYSIELCNKALDSITLGGRDRYAVEVERNSLLKLKDDIKLLPSAQPETHWTDRKVVEYPLVDLQSMRCANCERYYTTPYLYYISEPNFCPHCGAATKGLKSNG